MLFLLHPLLPAGLLIVLTVALYHWTTPTPEIPPLSQFQPRLPSDLTRSLWGSPMAAATGRAMDSAGSEVDDLTIFVSMAHLLDVFCPLTLVELFTQARRPERVVVGLVDQRYDGDSSCLSAQLRQNCATSSFCMSDNVRVRWSIPTDGWGPTFGRFMASLMYRGEHYFLMIDSHSRFIPHWDMKMIENARMVPPRSVLSHYPCPYNSYRLLISYRQQHGMMVMCAGHYNTEGIVRLDSRHVNNDFAQEPVLQPFTAAGFLFGDAAFAQEVPFDPHLYFIFDGEEFTYSARLWTHGFDLYAPRDTLLFHHYERHGAPRFWTVNKNYADKMKRGYMRVRYILQTYKPNTTEPEVTLEKLRSVNNSLDVATYGMGKQRSLADYYEFARVDPVRWRANHSFCDDIEAGKITSPRYHPLQRKDA